MHPEMLASDAVNVTLSNIFLARGQKRGVHIFPIVDVQNVIVNG